MRIKISLVLCITALIVWCGSCRKDFEYGPSSGNLSFSKDTVYLDTIFSTIGSSTYTLKVFNNNRDDVVIPSIRLKNGTDSYYRLNVDGVPGKEFQNVPIYAQDSLFIFIETTVDISDNIENTLLYTDAIEFDVNTDKQEVQLVTLVKDAIFLYPKTKADGTSEMITLDFDEEGNEIIVTGFELDNTDLNFTNEKPYVIYGYAVVPQNKELIIDSGARIHFHKDSGILVKEGGAIKAIGGLSENQELLENEIVFEGDRLEPNFSNIPGQWSGIWLASGSTENVFEYTTIKNGVVGLYVQGDNVLLTPTLNINNSHIYNNSNHNLWAETAFIAAENLILGNAGSSSLYCNLGGNYTFVHSTIANYWSNGFRIKPALEIDNFKPRMGKDDLSADLSKADFKNCIIYGNGSIEISLNSNTENEFNFSLSSCLLRFDDFGNQLQDNPLYNFEMSTTYENILLNGKPDFFRTIDNDFRIGLASEGINIGNTNFTLQAPLDILGTDRTSNPDLGAFQANSKE